MPNKLTNKETKDISIKLRRSLKNTKEAIEEFKNVGSIVNHDQLLRTCLNAKNPKDRVSNIAELLTLRLDHSIEQIVLKILQGDHLINVLRIFNVADFVSNKNLIVIVQKYPKSSSDYRYWSTIKFLTYLKNKYLKAKKQSDISKHTFLNEEVNPIIEKLSEGSFLRFSEEVIVFPKGFNDFGGLIDPVLMLEKYVEDTKLAYYLCDQCLYFKRSSRDAAMDEIKMGDVKQIGFKAAHADYHEEIDKIYNKSYDEIEELIIKLSPIKHFELLKIPYLESYINRAYKCTFIPKLNNFTKKIEKLFLNVDTNRNEITDKQYWFYYSLIEKIKEKGYKTQPASKIAERLLNLTETGSIRSRYYSKKKIVDKDKNFKLDDFIYKQGFTEPINDFLEKVERV